MDQVYYNFHCDGQVSIFLKNNVKHAMPRQSTQVCLCTVVPETSLGAVNFCSWAACSPTWFDIDNPDAVVTTLVMGVSKNKAALSPVVTGG